MIQNCLPVDCLDEIQRVEIQQVFILESRYFKETPTMASSNNETFSQEGYNHGGLITFALAMGFSIVFFIALLALHPGVDLKEITPEKAAQPEAAAPTAPAPAEEKAQ